MSIKKTFILLLVMTLSVAFVKAQVSDDCMPRIVKGFEKNDINYRLQIGAFSKEKNLEGDSFFDGIPDNTDVEIEEINGSTTVKYRYYAGGAFKCHVDATRFLRKRLTSSYPDAFAVAFGIDNERLGKVTRAMKSQLCLD